MGDQLHYKGKVYDPEDVVELACTGMCWWTGKMPKKDWDAFPKASNNKAG